METWVTENQSKNMRLSLRIKKILHHEQTPFQELFVVDTYEYGRMLVLDGAIQTTETDEFVYHELITHVPLFAHPKPERVCIVGGGDGGAVREILKHPEVKNVVHVEIDGAVVDASKKWLPEISVALSDPRVGTRIADGLEHIKQAQAEYDVIIIDSSEPEGPGVQLFEVPFYANCHKALRPGGLMVAQTESPFTNADILSKTYKNISAVFPTTRTYLGSIPTYPSGLWSFTCGSTGPDPTVPLRDVDFETRYYTPALHQGVFALPRFVQELLED